MAIKAPTTDQIVEVGTQLGMSLSEDEASQYLAAMQPMLAGYGVVDLPWRTSCRRSDTRAFPATGPRATKNPHNGWYWKTAIKGAAEGPLAGKRVGIKDNVCVAGVPMMNGASVLEGYVPEVDATVVSRILDAGGEIAGKTACEYLCFSGASHTNATGNPVHNPWKHGYTSGGSSSGSGAVVAAGDVEMAIGGDPGRLDPHTRVDVRHRRAQAHAWPRALHRRDAHRAHHRSRRADDRHRRQQRAPA